jgi:hypothetical protein
VQTQSECNEQHKQDGDNRGSRDRPAGPVCVEVGAGSAANRAPALGNGTGALRANQVLAAHPDTTFPHSVSQMNCVGTRAIRLDT